MKLALSDLRPIVEEIVSASALKGIVRGIDLQSGSDLDGGEFIRVLLSVTNPEDLEWDQISSLVRTIEDTLGDNDERFSSVRFAEAA